MTTMSQHTELPAHPIDLPLLPLRDVVVFPYMVIPLFVGRPKSIRALESAMEAGKQILLLAQKNAAKDEPVAEDMYDVGTVATILQMLKLPDGTVKVLVEGSQRALVESINEDEGYFVANARPVPLDAVEDTETEAMRRALLAQFDQFVKLNKKIPPEVLTSLSGIERAGRLADTIAAHLPLKLEQKQDILEMFHVGERLEHLLKQLESEIDILQVEKRIRGRVKRQMEKSQREYYLNEQVKAIQKELGEIEEGAELDELEKKLKAAGLPKEAKAKAEAELKKLKMMSPMSAEATVVRNYIDTVINLPWKKKTKISKDLAGADLVLEQDHYGLEKVKERIVEYLAVQQRVDKLKAPILCLVGPPGVGKTSLGQSIARATNRKFVRMALGGVRDEAEIRGHRRTYIGSMPGKILQSMSKAGVKNPLFLLDEVDKMGQDFRGDPSSALLEVLDPEQNQNFVDHYVEVEYDLSDVMFVATANSLNIPAPLLDRMEIIRLAGYTEDEKVNIAEKYLVPKQMKANGLKENELVIQESALRDIVRYYTREAGVRSLDREVAKICRKVVKTLLLKPSDKRVTVNAKNLDKYLGVRKFTYGLAEESNQVGQVTGLAWTEVGGELLTIESVVLAGKGSIIHTGTLGDVMKESIQAALSVVRSRAQSLGIEPDFYQKHDIHIHMPEGATPKDGPSAGIAITTAMVSVLTGIPVRADVAMTGEITLRGEVLPIGGLKEKLLAAHRGGIKHVLIPEGNAKDLVDIPDNIKQKLEIHPVKWIDQVLALALERQPVP
ncbi:endopeptidase La, partial [Chitinimonas sp.]|uniref:endopeptidase La n=1 Tax=Chitinimonas sp. TaxID=1934313 RepID=UPI0035AE4B2F